MPMKAFQHIEKIKIKIKMFTIFPDANINAVVFGSLILMITAAKRCTQGHMQKSAVNLTSTFRIDINFQHGTFKQM